MVIFIASETVFFGGLFAAYYLLRSENPVWPPASAAEIFKPGPFLQAIVASVILWSSSLPAHVAGVSLRREDFPAMRRWVWLTIVMGCVFLLWKFTEWSRAPFAINSHAYGTMFFTLTGFHALHLVVGLILLGGVLVRLAQDAYRGGNHAGPEAVLYYCHFVDAVWLGVFTTIYLVR
jgi:cytochrome c oxidase subunit 3